MSSASVIIPTFNKARRLERVLESFAYQTMTDFEIVICNDGSTDDTESVIERFQSANMPYRLKMTKTKNQGAGAARNAAVHIAEGDVLIFNDDDMVPIASYVEEHVHLCQQGSIISRGERWAIPLERVDAFLDTPLSKERFQDLWQEARLTIGERWMRKTATNNRQTPFKWLVSCTSNIAISHAGFLASGGFDEQYGTRWGAEDTDFGFCAEQAGWLMKWNPAALNCHLEHSASSGDKFKRALVNFQYFKEKHQHPAVDVLVDFIMMQVEDENANELFNEQEFTDEMPPVVVW